MSTRQENLRRVSADAQPINLTTLLTDVVRKTREDNAALSLFGKTTKLGEEHGELCEAVLVATGEIVKPNKVTSVMEETADVILMAVDICASVYPTLNNQELVEELTRMIEHKIVKWERLMELDGEQ